VAVLAAAAARQGRLPGADVALMWRAAWVHDLGRITVSAAVWESAAP
jgi:HD-GYP domain-containing protein (c-di-GMP phosphodiesterase class II)